MKSDIHHWNTVQSKLQFPIYFSIIFLPEDLLKIPLNRAYNGTYVFNKNCQVYYYKYRHTYLFSIPFDTLDLTNYLHNGEIAVSYRWLPNTISINECNLFTKQFNKNEFLLCYFIFLYLKSLQVSGVNM